MKGATTQYGFEYGAAKVERMCSDDKRGWVLMSLKTPKADLQLYVTKTGKVRIFGDGKRGRSEWRPK